MMKKLYKRLIIGTLLLTMGISISARIVAVNSSLNTTVSKIEESNKTLSAMVSGCAFRITKFTMVKN